MSRAFGSDYGVPNVHTLVAGAPEGHLFVAERDGVIVGTASSVAFGPTGWLGGVTVADEARGPRLGQALTEVALEALGPRETYLLLASEAGRRTYERLGFTPELAYRGFDGVRPPQSAPLMGSDPLSGGDSRGLTPEARKVSRELDFHATGEDRSLAVEAALDGAIMTPDGGGVALKPPWPARPILARDPDAGATLLRAVMQPGIRFSAPEANAAAIELLQDLGCPEARGVVRMRLGKPVAWHPEEVWGVFSYFFG